MLRSNGQGLFVHDDTVRTWYQDYQENGIEGLANFGHEGGTYQLASPLVDDGNHRFSVIGAEWIADGRNASLADFCGWTVRPF